MEKNKPTKEEILLSHIGKAYNRNSVFHQRYLNAMDEWAEIYHKEKMREELKAFNSFVIKLEEEGKIWLVDTYIDEYLKQKQ